MSTKTYTARCEWDDSRWWVVTVPELPGAVTQCRRIDQVAGDVDEVIALLTGERPGDYELRVDPHLPGAPGETAARANALRAHSEQVTAEAQAAAAEAVRALREAGLTFRDIGSLVGMSYQRAHQIAGQGGRRRTPATARSASQD